MKENTDFVKESKNVNDNYTGPLNNKSNNAMRRGKPQQQIYRPGSGPLRKSGQQEDLEQQETNSHYNPKHTDRRQGNSHRLKRNDELHSSRQSCNSENDPGDSQKRQKKPEQPLYIPKPIAQAKAERDNVNRKNHHKNENWNHNDRPKSSRCFTRNEYHTQNGSIPNDRINVNKNRYDRDIRQGSEPRNIRPHTVHTERVRDTRSVEPSNPNRRNDKLQSKPPSGRRHSINEDKPPKNLDNLPPRFRNKYLANNNRIENNITPVPEDTWDGNSLVFKNCGNNISYNTNPNFHVPTRPPGPIPSYVSSFQPMRQMPVSWSNTVPNPRYRGRGRLRQDFYDINSLNNVGHTSPTYSNSRPETPIMQHAPENLSQPNSRCQTPVDYARPMSSGIGAFKNYEKNETHGDPNKIAELVSRLHDDPDEILDWSEEVELNAMLEAEIMSDSNTRCSSPASLMDESTLRQHQQSPPQKTGRNRKGRRRTNRSRSISCNRKGEKHNEVPRNIQSANPDKPGRRNNNRQGSRDGNRQNRDRENRDDDGFRVPTSRGHGRRNSYRDRSNDRYNNSRHSSLERQRRNSNSTECENWREEIRIRRDSERQREEQQKSEERRIEEDTQKHAPGIIILPKTPPQTKPPVLHLPEPPIKTSPQQKTLFDPDNPNKPIVVTASSSRAPADMNQGHPSQTEITHEHFKDMWYDRSDNFKACHEHLLDVKKADMQLQYLISSGALLHQWNTRVAVLRQFLHESLEYLLIKDLKFCQMENVENHYWRILYYNIIEIMRKSENKEQFKTFILSLIDEGTKYFEKLLEVLEDTYKFKLENFLGINNIPPPKKLGFVGLALVSAQKIFLFLGDLARYKEQVNESSNYAKCKQWYIKAQEVHPKNGRPYNQLALLAIYARRKLDAVYFYMRSLMSSNPVQSAKESLLSLFDENRKKYEQSEKKRRDEKSKLQMKEKECAKNTPSSLRREIWVHPDGGRRVHRTTSAAQERLDSDEEELKNLSSVEVNKRFITSYLHVHGKLITKIGMETFQDAAIQMLREFRVLLQKSPIPMNSHRFLQLLALNMFAIESTQLKGPQLEPTHRSEVQERALVVSLQMFNVILERCVELLREELELQRNAGNQPAMLCQDLQVVLPAVKAWCDWMLCHSSVWNPPPSCSDYRIGLAGDAWQMLATMMNLLEKLEYQKPTLESEMKEGFEMVRLPEDATMYGFTPLMHNTVDPVYVNKTIDRETAQICLRISKILFFGTVYLCGLEPPVLKLHRIEEFCEYVSVVGSNGDNDSPPTPPELQCSAGDVLVESFSEDEGDEDVVVESTIPSSEEVQNLLDRKVELEKQKRNQELHSQQVQAILQQSVISVELEIRPRHLVPDTNCFIDYLPQLQTLARTHGTNPYTLMVPLVVLGELEGLARGGKSPLPAPRVTLDPEHLLKVAEASRRALDFLRSRNPQVKCVTTRGTVLVSSAFTSEDDKDLDVGPRNDDRILATCLSLCKNKGPDSENSEEDPTRKLYREVVLLTEDRNLRVKALSRDVPVRELPDFLAWANIAG